MNPELETRQDGLNGLSDSSATGLSQDGDELFGHRLAVPTASPELSLRNTPASSVRENSMSDVSEITHDTEETDDEKRQDQREVDREDHNEDLIENPDEGSTERDTDNRIEGGLNNSDSGTRDKFGINNDDEIDNDNGSHSEGAKEKDNDDSDSNPNNDNNKDGNSDNDSDNETDYDDSDVELIRNPFGETSSSAMEQWKYRKTTAGGGEESSTLDELMVYQGLEEVKQQLLDIKSKVEICKKQDPKGKRKHLQSERFNVIFQGNPGTGKTTVARLYGKFLKELGILESGEFQGTTGMQVAVLGASGIEDLLDEGVVFVDEAYQLTAAYIDGVGRQALDLILTAMENKIGELVFIFVGYHEEMESFFEHNPGLSSRIPYTLNFADFNDADLWKILVDNIRKKYGKKMRVEDGLDGLYMRIAIRRLAQGRGSRGFGNARAVENLLARISQRQARRLMKEKREIPNVDPDYFFFTKEDIIGPNPSDVAKRCSAWDKLQKLIGLEQVKNCVQRLVGMLGLNYEREMQEKKPLRFSLNQVFVGEPGTGKTTVAKLYGRILADLGYLSRGDVVLKNPADFIGECLGKSEAKTRKILEATVGKVLVIDEAYMLDAGDPSKEQDKFKTGVIDTIVSMIQGVPGEDRCIVLVGYEDKIRNMFHNVNPGLSRRFPIERPFRFKNFTLPQMRQILESKLHGDDLSATEEALRTAESMFEKALMRPKFSNAGEVDKLLATAKLNYEMRLSDMSVKQKMPSDLPDDEVFKLHAADFDPDVRSRTNEQLDCRKILNGMVQESIIEKLVGYQQTCIGARKGNFNPRDHVPTNFIFKGPSGTGKTTTAQHMGKIFYNMGFLSDREVIECSATDLIGQYVGQTAPKTKRKLEEGMGRVLFIDEAYRLTSSSFAQEAVDEIIQFLTQPANAGKMIIILAGYEYDIHDLMLRYPALSGLFPEELIFETMKPGDCISLLARELRDSYRMKLTGDFLNKPGSQEYKKIQRLFKGLSTMPGWANARDVKTLANQLVNQFLRNTSRNTSNRELSSEDVLESMQQMLIQRRARLKKLDANGNLSVPQQPRSSGCGITPGLENPQLAPSPPRVDVDVHTPSAAYTNATRDDVSVGVDHQTSYKGNQGRGDGFSMRSGTPGDSGEMSSAQTAFPGGRGGNCDGGDGGVVCNDETSAIQKRMKSQEAIDEALEKAGLCVAGYKWNRVAGGYRCAGGSHTMSDMDLKSKML